MSLLTDLRSKGVSQIGATQAVLGLPLSRAADREILQRLSPPIARESLRQPAQAQQIGADALVAALLANASGDPMAATFLSQLRAEWQRAQQAQAADAAKQRRIAALRASIENTAHAIGQTMRQLLQAALPKPNVPQSIQELQLRMLQGVLRNLVQVLNGLAKQLYGSIGDSGQGTSIFGARTADNLGSGAQNQADFEELKDTRSQESHSGGGRNFA
jgi:hypothetical protein